jgi:hypothetical protein
MASRIFIVGNSRSGTTMMARIIAGGGDAADLRELHYIEQMVTGAEFVSDAPIPREKAEQLANKLISIVRDGYFFAREKSEYDVDVRAILPDGDDVTHADVYDRVTRAEAAHMGKAVPIDQTPRNLFYMTEILDRFPDSRIVNMVRDPRDVLASQKGKWKRRRLGGKDHFPLWETLRSWANYHPLIISKIWRSGVAIGQTMANDERILTVRFEDVLRDPRTQVAIICEHCEIAFDPAMLEIQQVGSSNASDASDARGVDPTKTGGWKRSLSPAEISICEAAVGEELIASGYEPSQPGANLLYKWMWWAILPVKLSLALALNLRRIRSLGSWAIKRFGKA